VFFRVLHPAFHAYRSSMTHQRASPSHQRFRFLNLEFLHVDCLVEVTAVSVQSLFMNLWSVHLWVGYAQSLPAQKELQDRLLIHHTA
jgi:hypothetical protein